ncbi:MAG: tRNA preQ1(34) S-adenosylmethionine ribosyltransferase-isomerase QueA [Bryobacteraceae bacterium]|jgi:S-adenosylmethionine:tRNA ribosyltransferase-isomerase
MDLAEFDFALPEDLIAQSPLADRAASRMLVVDRAGGSWEDRQFRDLPAFLGPGDCLVLNDSRVFPARLFGHRAGRTGAVEVLLLRPVDSAAKDWEALVHPGKKMRVGERVVFGDSLEAEVVARREFGERTLRFYTDRDVYDDFEKLGHVPLPPYIKRADEVADRERYQTVFAREKGSAAAPTAGLHFTPEVLEACREAGADIAFVTLHVGLGTFQPIHDGRVEGHRLHREHYHIAADNAVRMASARRRVAVGTTSVRSLESAMQSGGLRETAGETGIFIYPGFEFRATGAMLTNFHLPRTSLLLLVCAFAGKELALAAYRHAVEYRYRFYSYGDCMLII